MESIKGKIEDVFIKTGKSDKGPWVRYVFVINGKNYATFNKDIGEKFHEGDFVEMTGERSGIYWNMTDMNIAQPDASNEVPKKVNGDFHLSVEEVRARALESAIKFWEISSAKDRESMNFFRVVDRYHAWIGDGE